MTPYVLGPLDTTIKVKFSPSTHPDLTSPDAITTLLAQFGSIDSDSIVLSLKPPKKAPKKPPKTGVALVPFRQISGAFAAVCASGREDRGLEEMEIGWAEGKEPPIIGWLRKQGKLGVSTLNSTSPADVDGRGEKFASPTRTSGSLFNDTTKPSVSGISSFSSFPETFVSVNHALLC